jgi:hypothetical protein
VSSGRSSVARSDRLDAQIERLAVYTRGALFVRDMVGVRLLRLSDGAQSPAAH